MKVKCGTDIIEINRIKDGIENLGDKFLNKIYTEKEIDYCESKGNQKFQHYAGRFAAKEATFKAISDYLDSKYEILWTDIEVLNDSNSRPKVNLKVELENIENIDISISHCKEYATAMVTVQIND